jgi:uncharacterized protein (DUF885 family)
MRQLERRERFAISVALVLAAIFASYSLLFEPRIKMMRELERDIERMEKKVELAKKVVSERNRYMDIGGMKESEIMAKVLAEIQRIAKRSGAELVSMKPSKRKAKESGREGRGMIVGMKTDLKGLISLIYGIQTSRIGMDVERLNIVSGTPPSKLQVDMVLSF